MTTVPAAEVSAADSKRLLSLSELLVLNPLAVDEVVGGAEASDRQVTQVVPGTSARAIASLQPGTLVVFERSRLHAEDVATDLGIRLAAGAELAGLVVESPPEQPVPEATRRLAAKFGVAVILLSRVDAAEVVAALDPYVRAPEVASAALLRLAIQRLCVTPSEPGAMLRRLTGILGCPTALMGADGALISGTLALDEEVAALVGDPAATVDCSQTDKLPNGDVLVRVPAVLAPGAASNLWLVARVRAGFDLLIETARYALRIAATAFTAHLALNEVKLEQQQRDRALLLSDLLESGESPGRGAVEQATAMGWRLWGWHVGVHVGIRVRATTVRSSELELGLERTLVDSGLANAPVARPDALVFWTTRESEPTPAEMKALAGQLRHTLVAFENKHVGVTLYAGLGRAHQRITGIAQSLQEAKEAAGLALTRGGPAPVDYVDAHNLRRLVADWYSAGPVHDIAVALIQPLWTADPTGALVRTLSCYLDNESSATATAAALHLHRNTVLYRLGKIRELLDVDLTRSDDRLAVHLAARASLSEPQPAR